MRLPPCVLVCLMVTVAALGDKAPRDPKSRGGFPANTPRLPGEQSLGQAEGLFTFPTATQAWGVETRVASPLHFRRKLSLHVGDHAAYAIIKECPGHQQALAVQKQGQHRLKQASLQTWKKLERMLREHAQARTWESWEHLDPWRPAVEPQSVAGETHCKSEPTRRNLGHASRIPWVAPCQTLEYFLSFWFSFTL